MLNIYDFQKRKMSNFIFNLQKELKDEYYLVLDHMNKLKGKIKLNFIDSDNIDLEIKR